MELELKGFVGVDWARGHHDVCVVDAQGQVLGERRFQHDGEEMKKLCEWLAAQALPAQMAVGIETAHGPVVETLLERGFVVFSLNPKQLDRFRDRFTVAGCKDDRLDARVLAESLRTDRARYRRLSLASPVELELRECSRLTEELQQERQRWLNRLGELLWRYFPALLELSELSSEWVLALCRLVPTPQHAQHVALSQIAEVLKAHRVRCFDAVAVLKRLQSRPLSLPEATVAACKVHVEVCLAQLELLTAQHKRAVRRLDELTEELARQQHKAKQRDVEILDSLPGVGRIVLATLCAEAAEPLRQRDYHALRALSGAAPVTRATGKTHGQRHTVHMRRACSGRLRNALFFWARAAVRKDRLCRQKYAVLRARGQGSAAALRRVADRLLFVTCALLRSQSLYDPNHLPDVLLAPDDGRAPARPSEGAAGVWGRSPHRRPAARSAAPP